LQGRRRVWLVVRVVATIVMLFILVPRLTRNPVDIDWVRPSTILWLAAALLVTFIGILLAALRWQRVLAALEVRMRIGLLLWTYLASLFVSNFLPSTIGGDVLRISRLSASNVETPSGFASVVLERMTGWSSP
jgi:glycosyltransferase 2 family protein